MSKSTFGCLLGRRRVVVVAVVAVVAAVAVAVAVAVVVVVPVPPDAVVAVVAWLVGWLAN